MPATLSESLNGAHDALAAVRAAVRRHAALPPPEFDRAAYGFLANARGVLHVGAHTGQERDLYGDLPVAWVEALPAAFEALQAAIAGRPNQVAYCHLVADGRPHRLGVSNNAGQSSSIYDFKRHKELWPDVGHVAAIEMESVTLAQLIERHGLDLAVYDTLVLDVQGAELLVLQGAGDYLTRFRRVVAEAADFEAYTGGCQLKDLDEYLAARGFVRRQLIPGYSRAGVGTYYEAVYDHAGRDAAPAPQEAPPTGALRLNLGAGGVHLAGFTDVDRRTGGEVYPLPYPDGSAEEVVASHVLEHFPHRAVGEVLAEWVRVLKPGGKIRLAVPDFEKIAQLYVDGAPVNPLGFVMGGQTDANDFHGCIFDRESLSELMIDAGLERIGNWVSDIPGCSQNELSLNLQGIKPLSTAQQVKGVRAVMSVPRFGPLMHPRCAERAFFALGIEARSQSSCYWAQQISVLMEQALERSDCRYVLTMDFDTVFEAADVRELYRLLEAFPEADAVFPLQAKRGCEAALFSVPGRTPGKVVAGVTNADLLRHLLPAYTGHFGLTLFRADSLRKFPRPWMVPEPSAEGRWDQGHRDADIDFWRRWQLAGLKAFLAPRVVVGHLEEVIAWPGKDLRKVYQGTAEYDAQGIPAEVER